MYYLGWNCERRINQSQHGSHIFSYTAIKLIDRCKCEMLSELSFNLQASSVGASCYPRTEDRRGWGEGRGWFTFLLLRGASPHLPQHNNFISSFSPLYLFFLFCTSTVHTQARGSALYISSWAMRWGSRALLGRGPDPRYRLILVCIVPGELRGECCSLARSSSASFHRGGEVPPGVDRLSMPWFSTQRAFLMDSLGDESHLCMLTRPAEQRQARLEMM